MFMMWLPYGVINYNKTIIIISLQPLDIICKQTRRYGCVASSVILRVNFVMTEAGVHFDAVVSRLTLFIFYFCDMYKNTELWILHTFSIQDIRKKTVPTGGARYQQPVLGKIYL